MIKPFPKSFFLASARDIAPLLLGHWLIRNTSEGQCGGLIVETEAYLADDPACHSFHGKTARNQVMWGPNGRAYVYFIYGCHHCVNTVCQPEGIAEAVLIRALHPKIGLPIMGKNRTVNKNLNLTNGPAKLCSALDIDLRLDGTDICSEKSPLYVGRNSDLKKTDRKRLQITTTKRIGISKAADLPLRFYLDDNPYVSRH